MVDSFATGTVNGNEMAGHSGWIAFIQKHVKDNEQGTNGYLRARRYYAACHHITDLADTEDAIDILDR